MLAPICLFTYNRLIETQYTVESLQRNYLAAQSELFVFSDGFKDEQTAYKVEEVREFLPTIHGFKSVVIIEAKNNKGLANSIIDGVTQTFEKYGKIIVLEDDLITAPNFLNFTNQALDFYEQEQNVQSISAYSLSLNDKNAVYFQIRPGSWGWATWKNRWNPGIFDKKIIGNEIKSDAKVLKQFSRSCGADMPKMLLDSIKNKNDSWYICWTFDHFRRNKYSVYPGHSYIQNIGFSASATHCKGINAFTSVPVSDQQIQTEFTEFHVPDLKLSGEFLHYFSRWHKIWLRFKLLRTFSGRSLLMKEIKNRTGLMQ